MRQRENMPTGPVYDAIAFYAGPDKVAVPFKLATNLASIAAHARGEGGPIQEIEVCAVGSRGRVLVCFKDGSRAVVWTDCPAEAQDIAWRRRTGWNVVQTHPLGGLSARYITKPES